MQALWVRICALPALTLVATSWTVIAQAERPVTDGVYTDAQAARGRAIYDARCQVCHGAALAGGLGPPLAGAGFLGVWDKRTVGELAAKIRNTMPLTAPATLSPAQAVDLVAHLLKTNAFRAGATELTADDTLAKTMIVAPADALHSAASSGASALSAGPPPANLAQMMRGMLFPTSNLIFNVQLNDPGEQKIGWQPGTTAFSWADWGAGIYPGWELVDYAALAIAESAPLMLLPGRRCENGRPVPVDRADWIRFTADLGQAGRAAYKASQSRNRDAVIEATSVISDACFNCHDVYRDKPGGSAADPSNKAARCL